jgi:hypothetical protein
MGVCFIHFSSSMALKGSFIEKAVQFLHIFGEKLLKMNYFRLILDFGKWQIFS